MLPSSSTYSPAASLAGALPVPCTPISFSMHSSRRCGRAWTCAASFTIATGEVNTCRFAIPEGLAEVGVQPSVGSVGDSYDNALAETIIGLYKTELIEQIRVRVSRSVDPFIGAG